MLLFAKFNKNKIRLPLKCSHVIKILIKCEEYLLEKVPWKSLEMRDDEDMTLKNQ